MLAIVILGVAIAYLAIAIVAVRLVVGATEKRWSSRRKGVVAGWAVGLAFFMMPFWDWLPSLLAHRYYCSTQARFTVNKTIDQWMSENKEVLRGLKHDRDAVSVQVDGYLRYPINQRLRSEIRPPYPVFLAVKREDGRLLDIQTNEILVEYVEFTTGYGSFSVGGQDAWKFWVSTGTCEGGNGNPGLYFRMREQIVEKLLKGAV